jgi:uncharacterized peroxidase-related enzyme
VSGRFAGRVEARGVARPARTAGHDVEEPQPGPRAASDDPQPTNDYAIGRYPIPKLDEVPEDMQARIESVQEKLGFVPNIFWTLAHRPDEFRAFFAYFDALMLKKGGGLTNSEREMIVVAVSATNQSVYCVAHHGAILRLRARNETIADQIAIDYRRADVSPRQRAMLDFAVKVATESHAIDDSDFVCLSEHGFSAEDAWDIGAITAFFSYGNRMANLIGMRPNDEFHALGRG